MSTEKIRMIVEAVSNEKEISREVIFEALEAALVSATKKRYGLEKDFRVRIDPDSGLHETARIWTVVDPVDLADEDKHFVPEQHITIQQAEKRGLADAKLGDVIEEPVESVEFGRIAAQTARQVIMQRLRTAKREQIVEDYRHRLGELVSGTVKKVTRDHIILDLGNNAEALLKRSEALPREIVHMGDRLRAYLKEARTDGGGPQLITSRACPEMLIELFKIEVPEIGDGLIEIKGAAREPSIRAKISVLAKDNRIDPVGACVGMRGSRVQAVSNELGGERVDIVPWDEDPAQYVINALSPAEVKSIVVDDETHTMDVIVADDQLSSAIGRNGQNVKLASQLTGWELNVISEKTAVDKDRDENQKLIAIFQEALGIDEDFSLILVEAGFAHVNEIAYVQTDELLEIDGLDEELADLLQQNAKNYLLTEALAKEERLNASEPSDDLLEVPGMERQIALELASRDIKTREDLAECATIDLIEIDGINEEIAGQLIMAARAPWFEESQSE